MSLYKSNLLILTVISCFASEGFSQMIDFGTASGKTAAEAAGLTSYVPSGSTVTYTDDACRISLELMENAGFLKAYNLSKGDFSITMQAGMADLGDGLKNNYRYGIHLFADGSDSSPLDTGISAQLLYDDGTVYAQFREKGINAKNSDRDVFKRFSRDENVKGRPYPYAAEMYTMKLVGTHLSNNSLELIFSVTDGSITTTLKTVVNPAKYMGKLVGASIRARNSFVVDIDSINVKGGSVGPPPAAPVGLTAAPGDNRILLDWKDSTADSPVSYNIYRSIRPGRDGHPVATGRNSSDYVDDTAVNGTTYYYTVTASDSNGQESDPGNEASASPVDMSPPAAPEGLTVAAGEDGSVLLDWKASPEFDLAGYNVYRSTESGKYSETLASDMVVSEYSDNTVSNGITYYYVVSATDLNGLESARSDEVQVILIGGTNDPSEQGGGDQPGLLRRLLF